MPSLADLDRGLPLIQGRNRRRSSIGAALAGCAAAVAAVLLGGALAFASERVGELHRHDLPGPLLAPGRPPPQQEDWSPLAKGTVREVTERPPRPGPIVGIGPYWQHDTGSMKEAWTA